MERRVRLVISGRVQGVGYRMSACDEAIGLGLTGWIRNLPGGSVESWAEGGPEGLARFIAWCRNGPPLARVDDVLIERGDASGAYQEFNYRF